MYFFVAGFLAGIVAVQWFADLPNAMWFFAAAFCVAIIWFFSPNIFKVFLLLLLAALLGCGYAIIRAQAVLSWNLPIELETKTVIVMGTIAALPQIEEGQAQFEFALKTLNGKPQQTRLRLAWYQLAGAPGENRRELLPGNNRCAKQSFACCQGEESRFSPLTAWLIKSGWF